MTAIEVLQQIRIKCQRNEAESDALDTAIKAIAGQPKYERALTEVISALRTFEEIGEYCTGCGHYDENDETCDRISSIECKRHMLGYYKKQAGLEEPSND